LATDQFSRLFTPDEANELIPRLEVLVRKLQANAARARARAAEAGPIANLEELSRTDPVLRSAMREMAKIAEEIQRLGCFLKDIDLGLVDFPGEVDGDTVFLCWQYGESRLIAWHPLDEGFSSRRPLPGSSKVYLN
jgi:hypothetical protein